MNERTFIFNLEKNKQLNCSITFLKLLYYSVVKGVYVSARNCEFRTFRMVQRIEPKDVQYWIATMSRKYGFSYQIANEENKDNQIYTITI